MVLLQELGQSLATDYMAAIPLALVGGIVAGMNPCCLALYPAAAGCCCSTQGQISQRPFGNAMAFVLGIAVSIAVLGSLAAYLGHMVTFLKPVRYAIAILPIVMGVHRLGWISFPRILPTTFRLGTSSAFGTGMVLSLIIGPCGTPILASILSFAAYKQSPIYGGLLLFAYGIGNGLPLVLAGTASGSFMRRFEDSRFGHWINPAISGMLILLGFYLLWRI